VLTGNSYRRMSKASPNSGSELRLRKNRENRLRQTLARHGIVIEETAYIVRSELILRCRKVELEDRARSDVAAVASTAA
jgi:hypothetical protein